MQKNIARLSGAIGLLVGAGALAILLLWWVLPIYSTRHTFTHPEGRCTVRVLSEVRFWPGGMPGQGGDAPGVVRLYDRDGVLLHEAPLEMASLADHVEWEGDHVRIPLVATWELPP